jgi:hypothetical protein
LLSECGECKQSVITTEDREVWEEEVGGSERSVVTYQEVQSLPGQWA